ncbi:MAG: hypothetical protein WA117_14845 [Verrucomicrobiia bacterium]
MNAFDRVMNVIAVLMIYLIPLACCVFCARTIIKAQSTAVRFVFAFLALIPLIFLLAMLGRMLPEPDDRPHNHAARTDTDLFKGPLEKW